jgi:hypothetical protein
MPLREKGSEVLLGGVSLEYEPTAGATKFMVSGPAGGNCRASGALVALLPALCRVNCKAGVLEASRGGGGGCGAGGHGAGHHPQLQQEGQDAVRQGHRRLHGPPRAHLRAAQVGGWAAAGGGCWGRQLGKGLLGAAAGEGAAGGGSWGRGCWGRQLGKGLLVEGGCCSPQGPPGGLCWWWLSLRRWLHHLPTVAAPWPAATGGASKQPSAPHTSCPRPATSSPKPAPLAPAVGTPSSPSTSCQWATGRRASGTRTSRRRC